MEPIRGMVPNICFRCFTSFDVPEEESGKTVRCPGCGIYLQTKGVPKTEQPETDPEAEAQYREFNKALRMIGIGFGIALALLVIVLLITKAD